jgi:DNA-binding NtrC family response regulator
MNTSELQKIKNRYTIVGNCDALNRALDVALQVAPTDLSVLIEGESGVGKEIIPRIIHDNSRRSRGKYFAINCGSIPEGTIDSELFGHEKGSFTGAIGESEGYFGAANGGTLFLDEVGELPLATQARLLRVLETGEYIRVGSTDVRKTDVRIVAASNVNFNKAITERRFREDLYYRLNTIPIKMPPLRDRGEDIILLFRLFAMQTAEKLQMNEPIRLTEETKQILMKYKWPGNVRQLKNLTEQMSVLSKERVITPEVLERYIPQTPESRQLVALHADGEHSFENERELLYKVLFELRGNVNDLRREMTDLKKQLHEQSVTSVPIAAPAPVEPPPSTVALAPQQLYIQPQQPARQPSDEAEDAVAEEYVEPENLNLIELGRQMLEKALERNGGNRKKAAQELGISDRTLYRRIKQYGLE